MSAPIEASREPRDVPVNASEERSEAPPTTPTEGADQEKRSERSWWLRSSVSRIVTLTEPQGMNPQTSGPKTRVSEMGDLKRELSEEFLEYTCPQCAHKFQASTRVALLSDTTQCPQCNHQFAPGGNVSDNVKHIVDSKLRGNEI